MSSTTGGGQGGARGCSACRRAGKRTAHAAPLLRESGSAGLHLSTVHAQRHAPTRALACAPRLRPQSLAAPAAEGEREREVKAQLEALAAAPEAWVSYIAHGIDEDGAPRHTAALGLPAALEQAGEEAVRAEPGRLGAGGCAAFAGEGAVWWRRVGLPCRRARLRIMTDSKSRKPRPTRAASPDAAAHLTLAQPAAAARSLTAVRAAVAGTARPLGAAAACGRRAQRARRLSGAGGGVDWWRGRRRSSGGGGRWAAGAGGGGAPGARERRDGEPHVGTCVRQREQGLVMGGALLWGG
jgi:hypothetical protein